MLLEVLTKDELRKIDLAAMELLWRVGAEIHDERALKLFDEAGARVDYEKKKVKIPEYLVREGIRKAPSQFTTYGRDGKHRLRHGGDEIYFYGCINAAYVIDLETDKVREATLKDTEKGARILDALETVQSVYAPAAPQNVPRGIRLLASYEATLRNTVKTSEAEIGTGEIVRYCLKLASAIVGSEEELRKKPMGYFTVEVTSPLKFHKPQVDILYECSIRGLPFKSTANPLLGATGPVTLAGGLALAAAEVLLALTLSQLINPGTPVIVVLTPIPFGMHAALPIYQSPEGSLMMGAANVQLVRYYGLPARSECLMTDAYVPGIQAGYEKMLGSVVAGLAGANGGIGYLGYLKDATSFVQMVIDDEIAGFTKKLIEGFEVNEENLALDVIERVFESGKSFLTEKHTRDHYREYSTPRLANKLSRTEWEEAGSKDVKDKAKERVGEILRTHHPEPLDNDVKKELEEIMNQAKRDLVK